MNLMAESRKNEDLVDLQCFIKGQENEDSAQQNPVGRIITPWGPADSLQQEGTRQKQKCAEQRGQIQLPIHVDHGQPVFIGPEDVDPHLREGVCHQQSCRDEVQAAANLVRGHRRMVKDGIERRIQQRASEMWF